MSADDGEVLDAYLDACLEGTAATPGTFLRAHPELGTDARERVTRMFEMATRADAATARERGSTNGSTNGSSNNSTDGPDGEGPATLERVGEYRILEPLGAGGMGMVFLAEQESLGRRVAVKLLHPTLLRSKTAVERFRREALALAKLKHGNVVEVYAVGEAHGQPFIAMELVEGRTLSDVLADGRDGGDPPDVRRVVTWMRDIAHALQAAHTQGIIHRDVKPANIRIADDGLPRLLDFGIARDEASDGTLTRSFAGSPLYAAPEQITGATLDARADVYGLGVTLYECLAGRVPFAGGPFDQVIKRVLDEDPLPPRRLNPSVSRDLDVVCCKALEKDPADRYDTAQAMADDLTAVLEHRPIRARPPSRAARVRKWGRRNPARATALLSGVAAALLLAGFFVLQGIAAQRQREHDALDAVATARAQLENYRDARTRTATLDSEIGLIQDELTYRYLPPSKMRVLDEAEDAVRVARREREAMFYAVLDSLRRAEQLDPAVAGTTDVRAALYREKWVEARSARDEVAADFYQERLRLLGGDEPSPHDAPERVRFRVTSDPPGAEVHVFRFVELSRLVPRGQHRLVAVPAAGEPGRDPAAWALRVRQGDGTVAADEHIVSVAGQPIRSTRFVEDDAGPLRRLDRLVAIDDVRALDLEPDDLIAGADDQRTFTFQRGGRPYTATGADLHAAGARLTDAERVAERGDVAVTIWRDGREQDVRLAPGLEVDTTALPVLPTQDSRFGTTPLEIEQPAGNYLLVFRHPGHVPVRYAGPATAEPVHATLPRLPDAVPGFVFIPTYPQRQTAFWIMRHEVTCAEYQQFLNDPETLRAVATAPTLIRVPRGHETVTTGGDWPRDASGRYSLNAEWQLDWPIIGVSWEDAQAYAAWMTRRARAAGEDLEYTLPTAKEWWAAGCGVTSRNYVYGDRFRPKWMASCFGRRQPLPRSIGRFPIDESPHGAFDMCGNAFEWLAGWYDEVRGLRYVVCGSWARAEPSMFKLTGGQGFTTTFANGETGFRLIARRAAR